MHLHAIIPAGGAGTRLWPLSTAKTPKFLLDLLGSGSSMLQDTVRRLAPISQGITVVTGQGHVKAVSEQLISEGGLGADVSVDIVAEPTPRDSMAAIGLATAIIHQRHGDCIVGSFAADHVIGDEALFHECVLTACEVASRGFLTTIGIEPTHAATGFGYIQGSDPLDIPFGAVRNVAGDPVDMPAYHVANFKEKPDETLAASYLAQGGYWWNAGMFIVRSGVLLNALKQHHPDLATGLEKIAASWDTQARDEVMGKHWPELTKIAIDHALAEPMATAGLVATVAAPKSLAWDDVGDYEALIRLRTGSGNEREDGSDAKVFLQDSAGATVLANGLSSVAVLGIPDALVAYHNGQLLVTTRSHAQDVKDAGSYFA
ncbi:MAG: mannose-1-phosphate guanylyltransferase [Actinomycetaceae bacterium]|nr:mannose-1-phosphate guanylyltransferase [Actinomycetaceae bacterium]